MLLKESLKRRAQKLTGKSDWFKNRTKKTNDILNVRKPTFKAKGKKQNIPAKIESILFCPYTPNSALKKKLQEAEDSVNGTRKTCKVKVTERAGPTIGALLYNKIPWQNNHCGRQSCAPCETKPGRCKTPGITYRIICETCKEK